MYAAMDRRLRRQSPTNNTAAYLRYLKPGALAQLRDSRISAARSHRLAKSIVQAQICPSPPRSPAAASPGSPTGSPVRVNGPPSSPLRFSARICGPRCPQRKKLVAARSIFVSAPSFSGNGPDSPGPGLDLFGGSENSSNSNILVAH